MTRRNNCFLPCPSDRGQADMDSMFGPNWTYDRFFDGIDDNEIEGSEGNAQNPKPQYPCHDMEKVEAVCNSEEIDDGLACPPMDEAYVKCEANLSWMIDGNFSDGIDYDAPVDSKTYNKNKGNMQRGKGKPQSILIVPKHPQSSCKGKELKKVFDLYSGSKMVNNPACGKGKELKILEDVYHSKAENESCGENKKSGEVMRRKMVDATNTRKSYELALESSKRKLQEDYEKCKRPRKIQLIGVEDLPKPVDSKPCNKPARSFPKRICKPSIVKQRLSQKLRVMGRKLC